ncbi:alpha/beta hydrolase [Staphylococcus carnosus]|nr:alpha/beta hydrolase [Staphylococcus carnosus]KOR13073.1 alpha/beta hydrolase [Staphylococcus carnosus]
MNQAYRDVVKQDDTDLEYLVYPAQKEEKGIILYFHGGGLIFGTYDNLPKEYINILSQNFTLISASYRLAPESKIDTIIGDALAQYDHIRQQFPDVPIFTFGRSAGVFLAMKVAAEREVEGILDFYGYSRFHIPQFLRPNLKYQALASQVTPEILNNMIQNHPVTYGDIQSRYLIYLYARGQNEWMKFLGITQTTNPEFNIAPKKLKAFPPTFIVHGNQDPDVPFTEAQFLEKMIPETEFTVLENDEHDFDRTVNQENLKLYQQAETFLLNIADNHTQK